MTAKQAIKARCRDCLAGARECTFTECVLKGLAKAKGRVKTKVIKGYCRWCLNGQRFSICNSPDCAIYQFRKEKGKGSKTPRLMPSNRGYRVGICDPKPESIDSYGDSLVAQAI